MAAVYGYIGSMLNGHAVDHEVASLERAGSSRVYVEYEASPGTRVFDDLVADCEEGDVVCIMYLNRIGTTIDEIVGNVGVLTKRGVGLISLGDGIDTRRSEGSAILSAFSALNSARIQLAVDNVNDPTTQSVTPRGVGRPTVPRARLHYALSLMERGSTIDEAARRVGCSTATVYRFVARMRKRTAG